jgi:hypothetical protein
MNETQTEEAKKLMELWQETLNIFKESTLKLINLDEQKSSSLETLKRIEAENLWKVTSILDPETGKPLYKNESARDSASQKLCETDPTFITVRERISNTNKEASLRIAEIEIAKQKIKFYDRVLSLF